MEDRRGSYAGVASLRTDCLEAILKCGNEGSTGWTRVAGVHNARGFGQVDLCIADHLLECGDEIGCIGKFRGVDFPRRLEHLAIRVYELDAVVLSRVSVIASEK